jgi:hypothetical protein
MQDALDPHDHTPELAPLSYTSSATSPPLLITETTSPSTPGANIVGGDQTLAPVSTPLRSFPHCPI